MIGTAGEGCQIAPEDGANEIFTFLAPLALLSILRWVISQADVWVAQCLIPLALWVLFNGLDDLVLDITCACSWVAAKFSRRAQFRRPSEAELDAAPQKRIAVFVPLWKEHRVIQKMVEHNIAANHYRNWDIFIGAYPNDSLTLAAIRAASKTGQQRSPGRLPARRPHLEGRQSQLDLPAHAVDGRRAGDPFRHHHDA